MRLSVGVQAPLSARARTVGLSIVLGKARIRRRRRILSSGDGERGEDDEKLVQHDAWRGAHGEKKSGRHVGVCERGGRSRRAAYND